ncbi:MAG: hypothetical protein KDE53_11085 [Caldilineaceae bacterium]|nr:hypothetical protein [Caldilineaceae bacterium]
MDHEAQSKKGKKDPFRIPQYPAGTWGPEEANQLMKNDGRYWRNTK